MSIQKVDVAQKAVTQQSPRLMPVRTFYGSTYNNWAGQLLSPNGHSYLLTEGQRQLGNFILPKFQRQPCWTMEQKTKLINSIYRGNPIGGGLIWNGTEGACDRWLLDGQQRLTAMLEYVAGEWPFMGYLFPDLPEIEKPHFWRMNIAMIETNITDPDECERLYNEIAYGGTPHDPR